MAITSTQLDPTEMEIIANIAQKELEFKAKLVPFVRDVSSFAVKGSSSIAFPKLTTFTVVNRTEGVAGVPEALTATNDIMLLNQNAYGSYHVDSFSELQSNLDVQVEFAKRLGTAHARFIDEAILAEAEVVGEPLGVGVISKSLILDAMEALCGRHADMDRLSLWVGCDSHRVLLEIADFVQAQLYGDIRRASAIQTGVIGSVYGIPVIQHSGIAASTFYMVEQDGLGIGFQRDLKFADQPEIELGTDSRLVAADRPFGVKGLQIGVNGVGGAESALVVKDGN
jgi:hypothetical protein